MSYGDSETPLSILVLFCFTIILTMSYHDDTYVDTVAPVGMYTDRDTLLLCSRLLALPLLASLT